VLLGMFKFNSLVTLCHYPRLILEKFLILIFFQNLTLGHMTKTLNQIFFYPLPKSEYLFEVTH
jgi:hypothetical protein